MKLLYFAWIRERLGLAEEDVTPPAEVRTVGELIVWLKGRGPQFEHAFARPDVVRAALDHRHARHDEALAGAREVALFPPMTGG